MATTNTRTANRSPVTLKIKFKSTTLDQFIERYSVDISHGGIFIRTKDPLPVGTNLKFEFQLKDGSPLITGDGTVVWTRDFDPSRSGVAPGMGVRFDRLTSESQSVLEEILAHKAGKAAKPNEPGFIDTPTKVAFNNVPTRVAPKDLLEELNQVGSRRNPLGLGTRKDEAQAQPYNGELDDFPDEAFEEATKVAALEALARRSAQAEEPNLSPFGNSFEEDVTIRRRPTSRPPQPQELARQSAGDIDGPPAPGAAAAAAPAPIFHNLPSRLPFSDDGGRDASQDLPPAHANPFSLPSSADMPGREGEGARARSASQRLRIILPEQAGAIDEEGPTYGPRSTAELKPEPDGAGSNLPWIAAAAALLLIGGVCGFLLLRGKGRDGAASKAPPPPASQKADRAVPAPAIVPAPPPAAPPPQPAPPADTPATTGVAVTIQSKPDGAVAELVGTPQSGRTPITFRDLVAGESYRVKISKAGYLAAELTFKPEEGGPAPVELEAKPAVLRVTSDPVGAQVWINGRRLRSLTPADVRLSARTTERKQLFLSLRKVGYAPAEQQVALDELVDEGETMVQEVALVLERRAIVRAQPAAGPGIGANGSAGDAGPDQVKSEGETATPPPAGSGETAVEAPASESDTSAGSDESRSAQPETPPGLQNGRNSIPDWMRR